MSLGGTITKKTGHLQIREENPEMATRKNQEIERKREMQSPESKSNNEKQIRAK